MRLTPGSPPPVLPAILAIALTAFLPQLSSGGTPFPQDLEPVSVVGREGKWEISCVAMESFVGAKQGLGTGDHRWMYSVSSSSVWLFWFQFQLKLSFWSDLTGPVQSQNQKLL